MAKQTGVPTILHLLSLLCKLLARFKGIIIGLFPTESQGAAEDAIDALMVACEALEVMLLTVRDLGD